MLDVQDMRNPRNQNGNGRDIMMSSRGSFSSVEEEIQESSCWIETKSVSIFSLLFNEDDIDCIKQHQDQVDDSKSDVTQGSQLQDGKFSLLQFALFNFKEALEK